MMREPVMPKGWPNAIASGAQSLGMHQNGVVTNRDVSDEVLLERWRDVSARLSAAGAAAIVLGGGMDLEFLTGYQAMPLERITAFVTRIDGSDSAPSLVVPQLEAARVQRRPSVFSVVGWGDTDNPVDVITGILPAHGDVVVSDDLWALHTVGIQRSSPGLRIVPLAEAVGGLRSIKIPSERRSIAAAGALADQVASQIQQGEVPLVGRSEAEIAVDIGQRIRAVGHETVEFVIVASGPNSASPHHHPGERTVEPDEMVLFDFGGRAGGYCSDTTRCVYTGRVPDDVRAAYSVLAEAQEAAVRAAQPGRALADVDLAAREVIRDAGYGDCFIHRTGHGIGMEVHEPPYVTEFNREPVQVGHAFSIEPGIYIEGKWGMRLEDIVVIEADGPHRCNNSDRSLREVAA